MILGIGVDIVKVSRIEDSIKSFADAFLERVFTEEEVRYCYKKKDPYPSLAVRFAAKEALIKAVRAQEGFALKDIEVVIDEDRKPGIRAGEHLRLALDQMCARRILLSLSHEQEYAIAYVVIEGD